MFRGEKSFATTSTVFRGAEDSAATLLSPTSDVGNAFPPDVTATSLPHPESPSLERHKIDRIAG